MVVLDVFSGAGGLSEGFWRNNAIFVGHVEADKYACETLKTRTAYWNLKNSNQINIYYDYLLKKITKQELWEKSAIANNEVINQTIEDDTFSKIVAQIYQNMDIKNLKHIDVIIGGPPCQAYSVIGRARMKENVINDPRNYLYIYYIKFLKEFRPKLFVFENVPGLLNAGGGKYFNDLKKAIQDAGYHMELKELIATDFGVLQNRKRIIIIGWNKKYYSKCDYPIFDVNILEDTYVSSIFSDLPPIQANAKIEGEGQYISVSNKYLQWSKIRDKKFNILTQHETRQHNERDKEIYKIAVNKWFQERKKLRYDELAKERPELITHKNIKSFTNRFNVVKSDEKFSHTVLAHIAMDGHYYIHPDINQNRSLSVREVARLQSFPDNFYFEGSRTAIFRQIGNAVPPLMAEHIAKSIKKIVHLISDIPHPKLAIIANKKVNE